MSYYTVVYKIEGSNEEHKRWWSGISPLFMAEDGPVSVTAVSHNDEMTRLDYVHEILDNRHDYMDPIGMIEDLLSAADPLDWKNRHMAEEVG